MPQVRSLQRKSQHGMAQRLPIGGMTTAAPSLGSQGCVLVASQAEGSIHQLQMVPFSQQATALADICEFAEALTVASLMAPEVGGRLHQITYHAWHGAIVLLIASTGIHAVPWSTLVESCMDLACPVWCLHVCWSW